MRHLSLALSALLLLGAPLSVAAVEETDFVDDPDLPERPDRRPPQEEREEPGPVDPEPETGDTSPVEPNQEEVYETRKKEEKNAGPSRIFKQRDRHGNVMFTDDPGGGGEEVRVGPSNSVPMAVPQGAGQPPEKPGQQALEYKITINSPSADQTFHNPGGPIPVGVTVTPDPVEGHRLVIEYDGVVLDKPEIPWPQNRGSHTVNARVVDEDGEVIAAATPHTIHVHKASKLLPPNN